MPVSSRDERTWASSSSFVRLVLCETTPSVTLSISTAPMSVCSSSERVTVRVVTSIDATVNPRPSTPVMWISTSG